MTAQSPMPPSPERGSHQEDKLDEALQDARGALERLRVALRPPARKPSTGSGRRAPPAPSRVTDSPVESFDASWRPRWRGFRRLVMLTCSLKDPGRFVAYGTDGATSFRVEGSWRADLSPFMALMDAEGADLIPPPHVALAASAPQPTFPDPDTVQGYFDARIGRGVAA